MKRFEASLVVLAMLLLLGVCIGAASLALEKHRAAVDNEAGKRSSQLIIEALDRYHQDHGQFPSDLRALAPGYLDRLPPGPRLDGFWYDTIHDDPRGDYYMLCFPDWVGKSTRDYGCYYMYSLDGPTSDDWSCGY